ncbi:uncharacterized protein LOC123540196 [Mercenaria mercenaria]|uniref:uncharacterized protein LOC123540196 n=1 Tax=Mercenaria mercenaria TaxID=6596 RepID=UPI00234E5B32|nr:uncharacterized protein LOC123540196 [Mercenaria mercenaria]
MRHGLKTIIMASGGQSLELGSDAVFQFCCSRCVKEGRNSEAVKFCEDCFDYICQACLNMHKSWVAMRSHKLLTMDVIREKSDIPPTFVRKFCNVHSDSLVEMFCTEHDAVLCGECCETSDHRSCSLEYLPKAAGRIKQNEELRQVKRKTATLKESCAKVEYERQKDATRVIEQNRKAQEKLDAVKNDLLNSLNRSVDAIQKKIDKTTASHTDSINKDVKKTQVLNGILTQHSTLLNPDGQNKMQLFLQLQQTKCVIKEHDAVIKHIQQNIGKETLAVRFDTPIKTFLEQEDCIGTLVDEQHPLYSDGDMYSIDIRGFCQLRDGRIFAADHQNDKVKVLDCHNAYTVCDFITVPPSPWDVCQFEDDLIAVACGSRIQFVNVCNKLSLKHKFYVKDRCRGITSCGGKLFVCCGGIDLGEGPSRILVFDKKGTELQDVKDKDFVGRPLSLAKSEDEKMVFVADNHKGVVILDEKAQLVEIITHPDLKSPTGICVGKGGIVYICGKDTEGILELKPKTKHVAIVKMKMELACEKALLYDRTYDRLVFQTGFRTKIEYVSVY